MDTTGYVETVRAKYKALSPLLTEQTRRCWAATEAKSLGYGGISVVARATALNRGTIAAGMQELGRLASGPQANDGRQRCAGGGRKRLVDHDPELPAALDRLVDPMTRGAPDSPLRWTCKGTARLAEELTTQGHRVSARTVASLLKAQGYSLQAPVKRHEGSTSKDRNAQFEYIAAKVQSFQENGWPVISVDSKKKELIGNFEVGGREWQPSGHPEEVNAYSFGNQAEARVAPYGIYDVTANLGWVSVGLSHDTPRFAVQSIREWWRGMGHKMYPKTDHLLITADGGGSNSSHARLWKAELQELANETGLRIAICHFPPGTSKWNKIEHRLFCHITENWRGRPLVSTETVVQLIAHTKTKAGLHVEAALDKSEYPTGERVSAERFKRLNLAGDDFHGDWNYWIQPQ